MSVQRQNFALNNSTSKQQFAFAKDSRFKANRESTNTMFYDIPGSFGKLKGAGTGHAFTTS